MKVIVTESQYQRVVSEGFYESEKLYPRDYIVGRLNRAPKYMREYMKKITNYCADCDVYCSKYDKHYKTIEHINKTRYIKFNIKKENIILEFN